MLISCQSDKNPNQSKSAASNQQAKPIVLKEAFKERYRVGTAMSLVQIMGEEPDTLSLVTSQFNSVTPENSMKWERIHPERNKYNFKASDTLVEFSNQNKLFLVGHTLVWHSQTPDWVFQQADGSPSDRKALLETMRLHIQAVAGRYEGKIQAWDVVNEALNEDGSLRSSKWREIIGDDYLEHAFAMAAKASPGAKLYYNDYNLFKPEKRQGVIRLVKRLQSKGIPIHGVGLQAHYALDYPDLNEFEDSIKAFAALGIDVMITELDVSVLPFPDEENQGADVSLNLALQSKFDPYPNQLPESVERQLVQRYMEIFSVLNRNAKLIDRVTFWGVHDKQSWRNGWPMQGRHDYPLLFDRSLKQKAFVKELPQAGL